jgi:hypothetical protein
MAKGDGAGGTEHMGKEAISWGKKQFLGGQKLLLLILQPF